MFDYFCCNAYKNQFDRTLTAPHSYHLRVLHYPPPPPVFHYRSSPFQKGAAASLLKYSIKLSPFRVLFRANWPFREHAQQRGRWDYPTCEKKLGSKRYCNIKETDPFSYRTQNRTKYRERTQIYLNYVPSTTRYDR